MSAKKPNKAIGDAYDKLVSAQDAVAGCGMFAPEPMKSRDLPGLIEAMQTAQVEFSLVLEEAGLLG